MQLKVVFFLTCNKRRGIIDHPRATLSYTRSRVSYLEVKRTRDLVKYYSSKKINMSQVVTARSEREREAVTKN